MHLNHTRQCILFKGRKLHALRIAREQRIRTRAGLLTSSRVAQDRERNRFAVSLQLAPHWLFCLLPAPSIAARSCP
jgi:hypothetical protein